MKSHLRKISEGRMKGKVRGGRKIMDSIMDSGHCLTMVISHNIAFASSILECKEALLSDIYLNTCTGGPIVARSFDSSWRVATVT